MVCCSHQSDCLGYVSRTNCYQIAALGYVSRTNQSVVYVLWFERCSNFNEVKGYSKRAVRKMESSFRVRNVGFYWDTCGSPAIKRLCFFCHPFFFSSTTKWTNCAIVPSGHWDLNTMTSNCDLMRVKVFTCWSRLLSWWWLLTLSCTDRARSHDEPRDSLLSIILYLFWGCCFGDGGSAFLVYDYLGLKILTDAYTGRIDRGQSTLDVIERYFWNGLSRERLKAMKALCALYANALVEKCTLTEKKHNLKSETKLQSFFRGKLIF